MEPIFRELRHYVFDLYGTLADIRTDEEKAAVWEQTASFYQRKGAAYAPEELRRAYLRETEKEAAECSGQHPEFRYAEISLGPVFSRLYTAKGVAADSSLIAETALCFRKASTEWLRAYDGAAALLTDLRKRGHVWLLTNAQSLFTRPELDLLGLTPLFDGIFISSECGCKKPDPLFFRTLLEAEQIRPEEAVMIGNDGSCDIRGGAEAGMKTIYLRSGLSPAEPLPEADLVMEKLNLTQLRRILTE